MLEVPVVVVGVCLVNVKLENGLADLVSESACFVNVRFPKTLLEAALGAPKPAKPENPFLAP